jgi:hypothetical protein
VKLLDYIRDYSRPVTGAIAGIAGVVAAFVPSVPVEKMGLLLAASGLYTVARSIDKRITVQETTNEKPGG